MTTDPAARRRHRVARPWRWLLIIYAVALTTGTHWPKLDLVGDPTFPQPDKLLHVLAFAGLMLLLWRTRWIASLSLACAVALTWAVLDEVTQALPGLGREVSWEDTNAGVIGIVLTAAWIAAMRPIGGPLNRMRLSLVGYALDEATLSLGAWLAVGGAFIAAIAITWMTIRVLWSRMLVLMLIDQLMRVSFFTIVGAGFLAAWLVLVPLWRRAAAAATREQACLDCGRAAAANPPVRFDDSGAALCPACGAPLHRGQWLPPAAPPLAPRSAAAVPPQSASLKLLIGVTIATMVVVIVVNPGLIVGVTGLDRRLGPLAPTTCLVQDLGVLGLALALLARVYRLQLARQFDARDRRCIRCAHDLRGTPSIQGVGQCGECGTPFPRVVR